MLSPKNALGIFLYVNIVSWLLLLGIRLIAFLGFSSHNTLTTDFYLKGLLLNLFLLIVFFFFSSRAEKIKGSDFVEILISLFILGLVTNTFSLILQFTISILETPPVNSNMSHIINGLYHLNIGLVMIFLTQAFFYWKKMVLHQRNETLMKLWNAFEYLLLISLLFNFFEFNITNIPFLIALSVLLFMGLLLSVNLKWVAYLNAKEKWQSILLLLFITIFSYYFFYTVISHSSNLHFTTNLMNSVYVLGMFVFVIFYTIFSLLVILFNLPTTSVFEKKIEEVTNFQRLAQSLQSGEKEDQVYGVLLDSAVNAVLADAAWLEIKDETGNMVANLMHEIDADTITQIKRLMRKNKLSKIVDETFARRGLGHTLSDEIREFDFSSILIAPLVVNDKTLGTLTLLKRVKDGFDEEKRDLINTFARQASISIENFRLLSKTIEAERYKEELKIAQRIQQSLLPKQLDLGESLEIEAISQSAYEVGGDYYDVYKTKNNKVVVIVGDVSGKGTNAAFHMAQMKGIFQGLVQLNLSTTEFLAYANSALANCLEKNSFITVTIISIDIEKRQIEIARAGHCPTLYFDAEKDEVRYLEDEGMGLGVIRNGHYAQYTQSQCIRFKDKDLILLYTDGIVEAKNIFGDEFGYDRLKLLVETHKSLNSKEILNKIMMELNLFSHGMPIHDDHTALLIKFHTD